MHYPPVIRPHTAASDSQRKNHLEEIKPRIEILLSDQRLKEQKAFTETMLLSSCRERRAKRFVERPALPSERSGKASCLGTGEKKETIRPSLQAVGQSAFFRIFRYTFLWISE
ncbi:hypothetical protein NPIL_83571 [Nephila pilipes]|uniref:Uncharacterized protein n=1 Tax=Nephila pilipes TaxID=299642 RepID=A0A8X6P2F1_NEPPI|nr:hypothetical protein NPIL_83571 [Nephila pilipes]